MPCGPTGRLSAKVELSGEEVWVPTQWEQEIRIGGDVYTSSFEADVESIIVNPELEEDDFCIDFPPGTVVSDNIAGLMYSITESGDAVEIIAEQGHDAAAQAKPQAQAKGDLESPGQEHAPHPGGGPREQRRGPSEARRRRQASAPPGDRPLRSADGGETEPSSEAGTQVVGGSEGSIGSSANREVTTSEQDPIRSKQRTRKQRSPEPRLAVAPHDDSDDLDRRSVAGLSVWVAPLLVAVGAALLAAYWHRSSGRS
jgi:hypothetical protein